MLILFCAAIIVFGTAIPLVLSIAVGLISLASIYELLKAMGLEKKKLLTLPSLATAALVPFAADESVRLLIYALFTVAAFSAMIADHKKVSFQQVGVVYSMVVLVPSALRCMVLLRAMHPQYGMFYVLVAIFSAWLADCGAYFAGTFFGKHKLCPEISPKKTVEGAAGGVIFNILVLLLSGWVFSLLFGGGQVSYLSLFLIGLIGSPVSILGDLSFSLVKRSCHIKDFSDLIPGHGGILDRFDSVIFTAPLVYLLTLWLPILP